jgi:hypothetical protein
MSLCLVSFILSVILENKPCTLSAIMLNAIKLGVVVLNVIMLDVVMLNVVAPVR